MFLCSQAIRIAQAVAARLWAPTEQHRIAAQQIRTQAALLSESPQHWTPPSVFEDLKNKFVNEELDQMIKSNTAST